MAPFPSPQALLKSANPLLSPNRLIHFSFPTVSFPNQNNLQTVKYFISLLSYLMCIRRIELRLVLIVMILNNCNFITIFYLYADFLKGRWRVIVLHFEKYLHLYFFRTQFLLCNTVIQKSNYKH